MLVCERGTMFGYSDLIVDPRNFVWMRDAGVPVTADVTHALQQPAGRALEVRCSLPAARATAAWQGVGGVAFGARSGSRACAFICLQASLPGDVAHSPFPPCLPATQGGGVASGGLRELIPAVARTAVAVGVQGLFMEVHDDPTTSPVDGPTQWPLRHLRRLLQELIAIAKATRGAEEWDLDLSPVGDDFDPEAVM